ncbi:MAG: tryptophan 7-halogenase [Deltaproteobacteria bacterium]|nr:tryptophan 7-halogenase [Deltaproteobacteria bacterium]
MNEIDVAILGGGLAGNLLARQLRREVPGASVAVFEKSRERTYKVGESTVEIATNYLSRKLGLQGYVYQEHLPKNGLRYFFDTEKKDAALHEMSEIGVSVLPPWPSFQLDRARLEADLLRMNEQDGVQVHLGARVKDLSLDAEGNTFTVVQTPEDGDAKNATETQWKARWVVDGTGRESLIAKKLDLRLPEKDHRIAAAWGRLRGLANIDDTGNAEFHSRVKWTSRGLSTNHFMYPGYWLWLIPLRNGLTSVGIVQEREQWTPAKHKPEGFLSFLREHRAIDEVLGDDPELVDLQAYGQLAFKTRRFFGQERWACVGDAGAFTDPFYSPGSDFIAFENDLTTDLIRRDLAGEDVSKRIDLADEYMKFRYDITLVVYKGLYPTFGSYDLFLAKAFFDTAIYYNLVFDSYVKDEHLDARHIRSSLRRRAFVLEMLQNYASLFRNAAETLKAEGRFYDGNEGNHAVDGRSAFGPLETVGEPRSRREINARNEAIFVHTRSLVAQALGESSAAREIVDGSKKMYDAWNQLAPRGGAPQ